MGEGSLTRMWTMMAAVTAWLEDQLATALVTAKYEKMGEALGKKIRKLISMYVTLSGLGNAVRKSKKGRSQSSVAMKIRKYRRKA